MRAGTNCVKPFRRSMRHSMDLRLSLRADGGMSCPSCRCRSPFHGHVVWEQINVSRRALRQGERKKEESLHDTSP